MVSCKRQESKLHSYYYWRTELRLNEIERKALEQAQIPYLYTRFFDVDKKNNEFLPIATLSKNADFDSDKQIVPVVFITNRTFLNIKKEEISSLANHISNLIQQKTKNLSLNTHNEIQIDCDWTAGTRDDFFQFLKQLHHISGKNITSTLRLHQVRDRKTMGIPPVSKVYLMCYSTSSPLENSDKNSILDLQILKNYLTDLEQYPIQDIDVALPIYSWGIVSNHLGKRKLINALSINDLNNPKFEKITDNQVKVLEDGFYFGNYMNKGFTIKIEEISEAQLQEVIQFLEPKIPNFNIIYYQLDSRFVERRKL